MSYDIRHSSVLNDVLCALMPHIVLCIPSSSLLTHPDAALTSLPDKDPIKEVDKTVPTGATDEKDVLPPLGGVVTTEKDGEMDSKPIQDNLTEDKDMELLDAHEEDAHSESKEQALIRLQNFI